MREYPFDKLIWSPDEPVLYKKLNPTFHREYDIAIVLSANRLCLWNGAWVTFSISELNSATLKELPIHPMKIVTFGLILVFSLLGLLASSFSFSGWLFPLMVLTIGYAYFRSKNGRLVLNLQTITKQYSFATSPETAKDEIEYDRKIL